MFINLKLDPNSPLKNQKIFSIAKHPFQDTKKISNHSMRILSYPKKWLFKNKSKIPLHPTPTLKNSKPSIKNSNKNTQ
jgi:hypothetical protein